MIGGERAAVTLPCGLHTRDGPVRAAVVRAVTGRDEEMLTRSGHRPVAERVTSLLSACVERLGDAPPRPGAVRALTVGDREALLLQIRRVTLGERIDCVLRCRKPGCGEVLEVELTSEQLLLPAYVDARPWHEDDFPGPGGPVPVRFRLPTGEDQEAVAALAVIRADEAGDELLERCLDRGGGAAEPPLSRETRDAIAARMAELDPQAELRFTFSCPSCDASMSVLFDTASFFFGELERTSRRLHEEVHTLACWYHWGEREILDLTAPRRRLYLELIAADADRRARRVSA